MKNIDIEKEDIKRWYLDNFERFEDRFNGFRNLPFHQTRRAAIARFSEYGFPTPRHEDWKYTNVAPILQQKFTLASAAVDVPDGLLQELQFDGLQENVVVLVNGRYSAALSNLTLDQKGVIISSLAEAMVSHPEIVNPALGKYANFDEESFTALNTAFTSDGTVIYLPDNTQVQEPIHLIHLSDSRSERFVSHPRNLFLIGKNSQADIIETFAGVSEPHYFNNLVSEVVLAENARLNHLKVQEEGRTAFHISNVHVHQERCSVYSSVNIDLGGALVRNNLNVRLNGVGCASYLFGFYMGSGTQHIDNHTFVDHALPHCFSNELYKGILDEKAKGVFNGKILVRPDAQKTNALQSNKTLLLTDEASINAKPQLEIFADDVKCTHGATIGQLDDEALFYLRARGIGKEMAGAMLRHAFIRDVLDNVKETSVREKLDAKIMQRFTNGK